MFPGSQRPYWLGDWTPPSLPEGWWYDDPATGRPLWYVQFDPSTGKAWPRRDILPPPSRPQTMPLPLRKHLTQTPPFRSQLQPKCALPNSSSASQPNEPSMSPRGRSEEKRPRPLIWRKKGGSDYYCWCCDRTPDYQRYGTILDNCRPAMIKECDKTGVCCPEWFKGSKGEYEMSQSGCMNPWELVKNLVQFDATPGLYIFVFVHYYELRRSSVYRYRNEACPERSE